MGDGRMHTARRGPALATAALFVIAGASLAAQSTPRAPDGHPDLQGIWLNDTATPLERPKDVDAPFFTADEARAYEQHYQLDRTAALSPVDPVFELQAAGDLDTYEPGHVLPDRRTSLITDPPDGKVPALTPAAQAAFTSRTEHLKTHYADNPEDLRDAERCLVVGNTAVPPLLPVFYNNDLQIVQTRGYVLIVSEMVHDARVVSLDRRTHLPSSIRQWKGDSIGHWEGNTLVVDTTNFSEKTTLRGSGTSLHVIERLTLDGLNTLRYQFTIDDPASFVRPWSGESVMSRTNGPMYEYACHEANYSLSGVLRGARVTEREQKAGATAQPPR
jgi:hypothetical protein